jgi:hypothetical protein
LELAVGFIKQPDRKYSTLYTAAYCLVQSLASQPEVPYKISPPIGLDTFCICRSTKKLSTQSRPTSTLLTLRISEVLHKLIKWVNIIDP